VSSSSSGLRFTKDYERPIDGKDMVCRLMILVYSADKRLNTCDHLLAGCVLAREIWFAVLVPLGVSALVPVPDSQLVDWWLRSRLALQGDLRPAFDCLVLLVVWILWKERNVRTFNQEICNVQQLLSKLLCEVQVWVAAGFVCFSVLPQLLSLLNPAL